jgi:triosephosphate isomerase
LPSCGRTKGYKRMRKPIIAGNWKMNTSYEEALALSQELVPVLSDHAFIETVLIPPFPWIVPVWQVAEGSIVLVGAQDAAVEDRGAFTGEVSAWMLTPFCSYIIVGHSERRHILGEDDELVAAKLRAVLRNGVRPILCVGELLDEQERGEAQAVVERQLRSGLAGLTREQMLSTVIAYEPVWAIGTGRTAYPPDAQAMAVWIREILAQLAGAEVADAVQIQYGGSVTASNAGGFLELPDIDGALVGGASLKAAEFIGIVESYPAPS